jgi:hypothetical protein
MRPMGERERIIERRRLVMLEKRKGKSLDDIHGWWCRMYRDQACSRSTIATDIRESLKMAVEETSLATTEWRQLYIQRIEAVLSTEKFQNALNDADLWAIDRFAKLMDQLIKLTGAYAPSKIAQTDPSGEREALQLTDIERADRIRDLLARAEERKRLTEGSGEVVEAKFTISDEESPIQSG